MQSVFSTFALLGLVALSAGCPLPHVGDDAGSEPDPIVEPDDAGSTNPDPDAGTVEDAGNPPPDDAGNPPPRDGGGPSPADGGGPPRDGGGPSPADGGGPPPADGGGPSPADGGGPTVPEGWMCPAGHKYGGEDGCDCNCGAYDPDCDTLPQVVFGCDVDEICSVDGICEIKPPPPGDWTCDAKNYQADDGCDCECGVYDPDCDIPGQDRLFGCDSGQICSADGLCEDAPAP